MTVPNFARPWWWGLALALLIFSFVFEAASAAATVVLHLGNGDRITGTLVEEDDRQLTLTVYGVTVSIPATEIERREIILPAAEEDAEPEIEADTGPTVGGPAVATPPVPKRERRWRGELQLGVDVGLSEVRRQLYHGRLKATYARDRFRSTFDYRVAYGITDRVLSANRMDGSSKSDYDVSERFFVYNLLGGGYDEVRRIDLRYELGPGAGYRFIRRPNLVLNAEVGINFQAQHREGERSVERFYYRFAEELTWNISNRLTFDEKLEFFPQVEDPVNFRLRFETNFRYELLQNIFLNLTVLNLYDTQPPQGVSRNDLQIRSSLGVKF